MKLVMVCVLLLAACKDDKPVAPPKLPPGYYIGQMYTICYVLDRIQEQNDLLRLEIPDTDWHHCHVIANGYNTFRLALSGEMVNADPTRKDPWFSTLRQVDDKLEALSPLDACGDEHALFAKAAADARLDQVAELMHHAAATCRHAYNHLPPLPTN